MQPPAPTPTRTLQTTLFANLLLKCVKCVKVFQQRWSVWRWRRRRGKKGTHLYPLHTHTHKHTWTHPSPTNTVTQSTWTAPWRVPLQLPLLYYWSIWRLLSQGWHGLGDVTAQPINTTLKAQDPQLVCLCVCGDAHVRACACVCMRVTWWKLQQLWLDSTSLTCLLDSNYMGRDVHSVLLTSSTNEVKHRQIRRETVERQDARNTYCCPSSCMLSHRLDYLHILVCDVWAFMLQRFFVACGRIGLKGRWTSFTACKQSQAWVSLTNLLILWISTQSCDNDTSWADLVGLTAGERGGKAICSCKDQGWLDGGGGGFWLLTPLQKKTKKHPEYIPLCLCP